MKRKLIYLANARIPTEKAHGIQIMKICESLSWLEVGGERLKVELVVPRRLNPIKQDPFEYYGVKKSFKITKLPTIDFISFGLGSFGFFAETIIFLITSRTYLFFKHYNILYTREPLAGLFFNNFCLETHSLPVKSGFLHKKTWCKAKAIFVLTSFLKNELIKLGVPEKKILILPDAVDLEKFDIKISKEEARKKLGLPLDKKIVMYVGLFDEWKGYRIALIAAKLFGGDTKLVMVGGLEKEVVKLKNEFPEAIFLGYIPYASLPNVQRAADILIIPNSAQRAISKYYTSPLKLFAHMASNRPIVASDLPSLREVLTEKEAVFFKPDDPTDLALKIKELLSNPDLATRVSQNALQKVQNYTWKNRSQRAIDFLNQ